MQSFQKNKGFTLAELVITTAIVGALLTVASVIYINFFGSIRNIRAANNIYNEARFTMERIVKEVRTQAVDYEEYYNRNDSNPDYPAGNPPNYGQNYCKYNQQFFKPGNDNIFGTEDDISVGQPQIVAALDYGVGQNEIRDELYLINSSGTQRTILKRFERDNPLSNDPAETIGKISIIRLEGFDYGVDHQPANPFPDLGENDGLMDTWRCAPQFTCTNFEGGVALGDNAFIDITPDTLDIKSVQYIIFPEDDPYKAYTDENSQIQPRVTIKLMAEANKFLADEFRGASPDIELTSTISSRIFQEVVSKCVGKECDALSDNSCPLQLGVCNGATRACTSNQWEVCDYAAWAASNSETYEIQEVSCSDGEDNDCDGDTDLEDGSCLFETCTNGVEEIGLGEECEDVGGICEFIHPLQELETICDDGLDNDCDGTFDDATNNPINPDSDCP